jgi:hypothetical protein
VVIFVRAAVECSVYASPDDPGLTYDEILEVGRRADFQPGELADALPFSGNSNLPNGRYGPDNLTTSVWPIFAFDEEPDYRPIAALDFVFTEFNELLQAEGHSRARMGRGVLIERAVASGISRQDASVAIAILMFSGQLVEKNELLQRPHGGIYKPLPSEQRRANSPRQKTAKPIRQLAYPLVKDVIERRDDARSKYTEPFDIFADQLTGLGYKPFRLWWTQIVGELRRANGHLSPVTVAVLSAALVEGALTFVVQHARTLKLGPMGSKTFEIEPRTWKVDDLVRSASSGSDAAILQPSARDRAERLIGVRQRIHAGRMRSDFPSGPSDLRPEEAREAIQTAEIVNRNYTNCERLMRP